MIKRISLLFSSDSFSSLRLENSEPERIAIPDELLFGSLKRQIDRLVKASWRTQESLKRTGFILDSSKVTYSQFEKIIEAMLNHIRQVAPGLSVPLHIPRVLTVPLIDAAGKFIVDSDGWVSISVSSHLLLDLKAAKAILAHELCHYVLENSGIRESTNEQNERLTDLCMFVCGFGNIYLDGYKPIVRTVFDKKSQFPVRCV